MSDPAGWYPDPTTRHELRYWDGYAWLDNVSDKGVAANDPLGGKPMPAPSEAAAKASSGPAPAPSSSKTPLYLAIGGVVVVLVVVVGFLLTRGDDGGTKTTALDKTAVTFDDNVSDIVHPVVHTVHINDNTVVLITVKSDASDLTPGYVVLTDQKTIDQVNQKVEGVQDLLTGKLRDACSNLREEDIGAKGTVVYRVDGAASPGKQLESFMVVLAPGDYEFVPVLVNDQGKCQAGKSTAQLDPKFLDFGNVRNADDLSKALQDDPDLASVLSGQ